MLATPAVAERPGQQADSASQGQEAVNAWEIKAQAGDKDASFALGVAYDLGQDVVRNPVLACRYYSEAGDRGHVSGAFNTGVMYDSGLCTGSRRADLAAVWYGRAAVAGSARAQFNLAQLYAAGDGVPRNPTVAAAWFRMAAANGIPAAASRGHDTVRASEGQGPLLPVAPAFPGPAHPFLRSEAAALVWTAPNQPAPVRFFVEVYGLTPSGPVELAGRYVDVTALSIPLPPEIARFTWRVLTVGVELPEYTIGQWQDFELAPAVPKLP